MRLTNTHTSKFLLLIMLAFVQMGWSQEKSLEKITTANDTTRSSSFNGYPYAFYTPNTKLAVGAGGIFIFYTGESSVLKPSKTSFGGYYSSNKQYRLSMNNKFYFWENKLYFNWPMAFGYYVDKFWGAGDQTITTGNEDYTLQTFSTSLTIQLPPTWFVSDLTGLVLDYQNTKILDKRTNEYLQNDSVVGSNGGNIFGIGSDLVWDTRDNIFFPNNGSYQYFKMIFYPGENKTGFTFLELDVRHFRAFKKDLVLAGNLYVSSTTGDVPFYKLPMLGGKKMRGFYEGRYRDKFYATFQMELRQMVWDRVGYAVFGGAGNVSSDILAYDMSTLKYNYGAGLRFMLNEEERVNLRVDFGLGSGGSSGIYFGIEEAF